MPNPNRKARKAARKQTPKRRARTGPTGPQGPAGPTGATGATGERGAAGTDHTSEITMMRAQIDQLVKELQTQLTRIGQLQAQLDRVESGRSPEPQNRRSTDRVQH